MTSVPVPGSTPSDSEWSTLLEALTEFGKTDKPSGTSVATTPSSAVSGTSGEYNRFTFVGAIASGGPKRQLFLWTEDQDSVCMGLVGEKKCCIKTRINDRSCGKGTHGTMKLNLDGPHFLIRAADASVYCQPAVPASLFSEVQIRELLEKSFSAADWVSVFAGVVRGTMPPWLTPVVVKRGGEPGLAVDTARVDLLPLMSPLRADSRSGIFQISPSLSFDSTDSEASEEARGEWKSRVEPQELVSYVERLKGRFEYIKESWSKPFIEVESTYMMVIADVRKIQAFAQNLASRLGSPKLPADSFGPTVWENIDHLRDSIRELETLHESLDDAVNEKISAGMGANDTVSLMQEELRSLRMSIANGEDRLAQVELKTRGSEARLNALFPLLSSLSRRGIPPEEGGEVDERLAMFERRLEGLANLRQVETPVGALEANVRNMQESLRLLELRVVGGGLTIGPSTFQSFEELAIWTKTGVPPGRFGLMVDGHSLLEFFSLSGHIDVETHASSLHSSQKTGFKTMLETRIAASMQNLLPSPFGKATLDKLDDNDTLPSISDPEKFDSGSSGVRHQIMRNMKDVSLQIETQINLVYGAAYPEARQMALDLLLNSKRFVMELLHYMSTDYQNWLNRGYPKKAAWRLTCKIVRRIYEDLQSARVSGRDACNPEDIDRTTASYIWAAGKTHQVQAEYLKHTFLDHPAISAVLARHMAATYTVPDTAKDSAMAETIRKLQQKVDRLEHALNHGKAPKNEKGKGN